MSKKEDILRSLMGSVSLNVEEVMHKELLNRDNRVRVQAYQDLLDCIVFGVLTSFDDVEEWLYIQIDKFNNN